MPNYAYGTECNSDGPYRKGFGLEGLIDELINDTLMLYKALGGEHVLFNGLSDMFDEIRDLALALMNLTEVIFLTLEGFPRQGAGLRSGASIPAGICPG